MRVHVPRLQSAIQPIRSHEGEIGEVNHAVAVQVTRQVLLALGRTDSDTVYV